MKRAALYARVSTFEQTTANQLLDLRQMAEQRGYEIVEEYVDQGISGAKARRPGLDKMMSDARSGRFDTVLVWAADRLARSVKHFVEVLSELDHLGVAFVSYREQIDTGGPLGRAIMTIGAAIAELERSLIIERVKAGLRRAGRAPDRAPTARHRPCCCPARPRRGQESEHGGQGARHQPLDEPRKHSESRRGRAAFKNLPSSIGNHHLELADLS